MSMEGTIDHLRRPILRIETPFPHSEGLLCQIDTGFNRYLLLEASAARQFRFEQNSSLFTAQIVLGDGTVRRAWLAKGMILWFGSPMAVEAHVVPDARPFRYLSPENQIDALIGTRLLEGLQVLLDFQRNTVTIRQAVE